MEPDLDKAFITQLERCATPQQRAELVYDLTRACYDWVKTYQSAPERASLGTVTDAALRHAAAMTQQDN